MMISLHHSDARDFVVVLLASGDEFKGWEPGCRRAYVVHRLSLAHHVLHLTFECSAHANMLSSNYLDLPEEPHQPSGFPKRTPS